MNYPAIASILALGIYLGTTTAINVDLTDAVIFNWVKFLIQENTEEGEILPPLLTLPPPSLLV